MLRNGADEGHGTLLRRVLGGVLDGTFRWEALPANEADELNAVLERFLDSDLSTTDRALVDQLLAISSCLQDRLEALRRLDQLAGRALLTGLGDRESVGLNNPDALASRSVVMNSNPAWSTQHRRMAVAMAACVALSFLGGALLLLPGMQTPWTDQSRSDAQGEQLHEGILVDARTPVGESGDLGVQVVSFPQMLTDQGAVRLQDAEHLQDAERLQSARDHQERVGREPARGGMEFGTTGGDAGERLAGVVISFSLPAPQEGAEVALNTAPVRSEPARSGPARSEAARSGAARSGAAIDTIRDGEWTRNDDANARALDRDHARESVDPKELIDTREWIALQLRPGSERDAVALLDAMPSDAQVRICRRWIDEPRMRPVAFSRLATLFQNDSNSHVVQDAVQSMVTSTVGGRKELRPWLRGWATAVELR